MNRNFKNPLTYALYLLELRDRSVGEIKDKMRRKKFSNDEIVKTIDFLLLKNFLDDKKFADRFMKEKRDLQHWGSYRIKMELRKKHISDEIIDELFSNQSENLEIENAKEAADLWRRKNSNCPPEKIYQRLGSYLSRRGFSYDIVKDIINDLN